MFYFFLFLLVTLLGLLILDEALFINEELFIAVCMVLVFFFLVVLVRKLINFVFFFRVEYIYFSFLNAISLNLILTAELKNLIRLSTFRFGYMFTSNLYTTTSAFINNVAFIIKGLNLSFVRNFLILFIFNFYTFNFFTESNAIFLQIPEKKVIIRVARITYFTAAENYLFLVASGDLLNSFSFFEYAYLTSFKKT